jgi:UDP-3-O-acyl-N-acetylglucosamine deacetylase
MNLIPDREALRVQAQVTCQADNLMTNQSPEEEMKSLEVTVSLPRDVVEREPQSVQVDFQQQLALHSIRLSKNTHPVLITQF